MNPMFYTLVGLPGSGKTEQAKKLNSQFGAVIHSNRCGDASVLCEKVIEDLSSGRHVVIDAPNISYKERMGLLDQIKDIECQKICLFMATPFEVCVERNEARDRIVPTEVLDSMYKSIWIPSLYEGWDYVELVYPVGFIQREVAELFNGENGLNFIEQDNPRHAFTVGQHCIAAFGSVGDASKELQEAALLHDIGKPYTKSFINKKGEVTKAASYHNHHHVSAHDSLFYSDADCDRLYVAALIQWHMRLFELERMENPDNATKKFKRLVGEKLYTDIAELHRADILARGIQV